MTNVVEQAWFERLPGLNFIQRYNNESDEGASLMLFEDISSREYVLACAPDDLNNMGPGHLRVIYRVPSHVYKNIKDAVG